MMFRLYTLVMFRILVPVLLSVPVLPGLHGQGFCPKPLGAADFETYRSSVKSEPFASNQMEVARQEGICLSTAQIRQVMDIFSFEENKVEFAKWAYSRCSDPQKYFTLNGGLTFSSSKTELSQFVKSQPGPGKNTVAADVENEPDSEPQPVPVPVKPKPRPRKTNPPPAKQTDEWQSGLPSATDDFNEAYRLAQKQMQSFFVMTFGGEDQIDTPTDVHRPDEDPATLPPKAPRVVITKPEISAENNFTARTSSKQIRVEGVIGSSVGIYEVFVNDQEAILTPKGEFSADVLLAPGENKVSIRAKDTRGQISSIGFRAVREAAVSPVAPPVPVNPVPVPNPAVFVSEVDSGIPALKNQNREAVAVVIGNSRYTRTKPVDYAENDARVMKKYLVSVLGFREGNILYYENASLGDFNTIFGTKGNPKGRLFNTIKQGVSDVVIFYSGHGAPGLKNSKAYFVPVEADPNYMENGGYSVDVLYENLKLLPARSVSLFSDACFSGADIFSGISPMVIRAKEPAKEGLKHTSVLSSCTGTEVSCWHKEERHGLFTFYLLKAMKNYAATDLNQDKQVSMEELFKSVSDNNEGVPYYARRFHGLPQTPVLQGLRNRILFRYP